MGRHGHAILYNRLQPFFCKPRNSRQCCIVFAEHVFVFAARLAPILATLKYTNSWSKKFDGDFAFFAFYFNLDFSPADQVLFMTLSSWARNTLQLAATIFAEEICRLASAAKNDFYGR